MMSDGWLDRLMLGQLGLKLSLEHLESSEHVDTFWGLVASFWIGNVLLVVLNVPLISIWVKLLRVPYRFLYPSALFFIAVGVYSTNNSLFEVGEVLVFGLMGAVFVAFKFPVAPILLGYVLAPMVEENFRRALLIAHGRMTVFIERPISAAFIAVCALLVLAQIYFAVRARRQSSRPGLPVTPTMEQSQEAVAKRNAEGSGQSR